MNDEVELVSDGEGLAIFGEPSAIERFLDSHDLEARDMNLSRLDSAFRAGSAAAEVGAIVSANAGRWVQVSEKSAELMKALPLMTGSAKGLGRAIVTSSGKTHRIIEIVLHPSILSIATNPAVLTGIGGIMSQVAMQRSMDEITEYLAVIDEKVDDVLRAQKDGVLADMIGVDLVIEDAMTIREQTGRVSDVTWSKVQGTAVAIARTQAYALRQLDGIADKLEATKGDLAAATKKAQSSVPDWLAVLARCFQLQDALAILELDRVFDAEPQELDSHRIALRAARDNRRNLIARSSERLVSRMVEAAARANKRVLLNPIDSPAVIASTNHVVRDVVELYARLGIEGGRELNEAKRWATAVVETRDNVVQVAAVGVTNAGRLAGEALGSAQALSDKFALKIADGARRRQNANPPAEE